MRTCSACDSNQRFVSARAGLATVANWGCISLAVTLRTRGHPRRSEAGSQVRVARSLTLVDAAYAGLQGEAASQAHQSLCRRSRRRFHPGHQKHAPLPHGAPSCACTHAARARTHAPCLNNAHLRSLLPRRLSPTLRPPCRRSPKPPVTPLCTTVVRISSATPISARSALAVVLRMSRRRPRH
jgi:hypothetical protein